MKKQLAVVAVAVSSLVLAACGGGSDSGGDSSAGSLKGQRLAFVNYGGDSAKAAKKGWLDPFSKKTGVQFVMDAPSDLSKVKVQVDSGKTTWDIFDYTTAPELCGKLFEKRPADFDTSELEQDLVLDDCGVPVMKQTVALVYNKKKFGDSPPTSLADFMDKAKYPGKRIAFNYWAGTVEPVLMADGVATDDLYPIDWKRAGQAWDKLGSDLTLTDTLDQQVQALESGDFSMCLCYLGRSAVAAERGADIGVVWTSIFNAYEVMYAVKGSKAPKAQMEFLQYLATAEGQNGFYKYLPYGSTIAEGAKPEIKEAWQPFVQAFNQDAIKEVGTMDPVYWSGTEAETADEWAKLTAG